MQPALRIASAVLPAIAFLAILEVGLRVGELATPELTSLPFREEGSLLRSDPDFFWSLQPNLVGVTLAEGGRVDTNSLGLRSPEVPPKAPGEFRILSLGESSTFGVGVSNDETYSALLEARLNQGAVNGAGRFRVINAGVPAWSSFQSLTFLDLRGLPLEPDLVLFYHEVNDYLPSSLRGTGNSEIGLSRSDAELHRSGRSQARRFLQRHLALARFFDISLARWRISRFQQANLETSKRGIGLPEFRMADRVRSLAEGAMGPANLDEAALPQRVSASERLANLRDLARLCRERGWGLLVIHPSYRRSQPHTCLLTQFCAAEDVAVFEAHDVLHPQDLPVEAIFIDAWHPTPEGHRRIANALADQLAASGALD